MASNIAPPRGRGGPTHEKAFAAAFVTTDLLAVSGRPQHAPQQIDFKNGGTASQNAVFTYQGDSSTTTIPIEPGQTYPVEAPVISIDGTTGDSITAVARWWHGNSVPFNA